MRESLHLRLLRRRPPPLHLLHERHPALPDRRRRRICASLTTLSPDEAASDIQLKVPRVPIIKLAELDSGGTSSVMGARVEVASPTLPILPWSTTSLNRMQMAGRPVSPVRKVNELRLNQRASSASWLASSLTSAPPVLYTWQTVVGPSRTNAIIASP